LLANVERSHITIAPDHHLLVSHGHQGPTGGTDPFTDINPLGYSVDLKKGSGAITQL